MRTDLAALTADLVAIDSVNPALVPGGAGETEIARFVAGWARAAGLEASTLEATPGRPSVLVRAAGSGGGRTLLLCAHLDTVGTEGMADAHRPRVDGDRLYGRGAYDMKAGLAAALAACRELAGTGLAGDVVVAAGARCCCARTSTPSATTGWPTRSSRGSTATGCTAAAPTT